MCEDRISDLLESILACVEARFDECEAPPFCRVSLVGGTVAWDDCCDCGDGSGQLWIRLVDWAPDPDTEPGWGGCEAGIATIGIGHLRCVPTIDEEGHAPDADEETEAARQLHADSQLVLSGVRCCPDVEHHTWVGWLPLGYEGGCGGGEHLFTLPLSPCCDEEETSPTSP